MNPAPGAVARLFMRLFAASLRLYPKAVRREYAAEMQAVFDLRVQDAARRGCLHLLVLAIREVRDLPLAAAAAHWGVSGRPIHRYFPAASDPVPWSAALLSLLPLFLAGPGRISVFYKSGFGGPHEAWYFFPYLALCALAALAGLLLGLAKKFPRWSYPYVLTLVFTLTDLYSMSSYHYGWATIGQNIFIPLLGLALLTLCLPSLRVFYTNIRKDWTLLSYSFYGFVLFLLAQFDRDEYPLLNLAVLLPSLIAVCTALASLRVRQGPARIATLLAGTLAGLLFWLSGIFTGMISIFIGIMIGMFMLLFYGTVLNVILLSPLLFLMARQASGRTRSRING
jgi:hypothetical protein